MNFLAHLYLSRQDDELMVGNFIADAVKGSSFKHYPEGIRKGILLHRSIDHFTDNHPVFRQSVLHLRPRYRKYSGVIIDIFYDHFLAKNWDKYAGEPLEHFTWRVHALMLRFSHHMPQRSQQFLAYMLANNIPLPYAELQGISSVLYGMSRRTKFKSGMEHAANELVLFGKEFEKEFHLFFPEVIKFTAKHS